jgi:mRNA interferase MazF
MTKYKIVLVPFPFDDLSGNKVRPAVCLTEPIGPFRHVVLAFITSKLPEDLLETDLVIAPADKGFDVSGLRVLSTLRLHRMMTVTTSIIRRELGYLTVPHQKIGAVLHPRPDRNP